MNSPYDDTLERFETALAQLDDAYYELTLFVIGASELSARAVANVRTLCDTYLPGRHRLQVVDLFSDHAMVVDSRVLATPTLVKSQPLPVRRLVGDLSETAKVLLALEIPVPQSIDPAPKG
jgi:circadian clock protein KaiB